MNFTPELSAFQGALLSADNVQKFSSLSAKGGNEDAIDYVIASLTTFLEQGLYITNGKVSSTQVEQLRKFALYIVLNSDLPELEKLLDLDDISTLIWTTPTIPKCLMCELLWNLHMKMFVLEIISFAQPQLALEVASAFLDHFKYADPLKCLEPLLLISSACYTLICRLHMFKFEPPELHKKSIEALNNFKQCLKYYTTPPNNYKLNSLRKAELYKYQGKSLYSLIQLMEECFNQFTSTLNANEDKSGIYKLTYVENSWQKDEPSFNICDSSSNVLSECLSNANTALLDTCKVLVMDVSVDVFCCWSEFEEQGKSMQQTIGELCHKVHGKVSRLSALVEHPLVSMLEQISRKPVEMTEIINATKDEEILQYINNNKEESKAWIKALVYKQKLTENLDLLNIVNLNLDTNTFDSQECYQLYTLLKQTSTQESENKDLVDLLAVKAFDKCDLSKKYDILEAHFANKTFTNMKDSPQFSNAMTAVFNKFIVSQESDLTDVLTLFIQVPQQVFMKIFSLASENTHQTEIMLKVMKLLERFKDHYYNTEAEPCIIQIAQKMSETLETEAKENNFIHFVAGLKNADIISETKLLLLIIMTNLHKALLQSDIRSINLQLRLLKQAYSQQELIEYRAPMLAMLGQVMDVVRWQINTFIANAPGTLDLAIEIQTALLKTYNDAIPENESQWLKSRLKSLKPLNMYYYRVLWEPPGSSYLEVVSGMTVTEETGTNVLSTWLSQVLCSCTQQEWCEIWDSLLMFPGQRIVAILHSSMAMLAGAERANRTGNTAICVLYCCRNYVYLMRYKYLMEPLTNDQVQTVSKEIAAATEWVSEANTEEFTNIVMPLFAYLTEKQNDYDINLAECLNKHLGRTKLSDMINRIFVNGTS